MQIGSGSENRGRDGPIFHHILMVGRVAFRMTADNNSIDLQEEELSVGRTPIFGTVSRIF